ncbi:hypothetical protein L9F63_007186, partial [Diploptera punctata]
MPLLRRKPFVRNKLPEDIDEDEKVFYCELTNEVFRDYEEFCQRVILCNSLVWSCSLTGKPQLTYQEALQSEQAARTSIKSFSKKLVVPVLYLANLSQKTTFGDLAEDVFAFVRERYFIGEKIEFALKDDIWFPGAVVQVLPPSDKEISKYHSANRGAVQKNGGIPTFPSSLYSYKVRRLDKKQNDITLKFGQVRRPKGIYTREKNKLFLKYFSEQKGKTWVVKDRALEKYNIHNIKIGHIFLCKMGPLSPNKKMSASPQKQLTLKKSPRKFNNEPLKSPQKQQLAKKLKDKYKGVSNMKKKDATKNILEQHKYKKGFGD